MDNKLKVGWAGLGNMGTPIVKNLIKAGFSVEVYNRTRDKEKETLETGAKSAASLQSLASSNDILFVMVSDDAAVKEIFTGQEGLLSGDCEGKLFIDVSTVSPQTSKDIAESCKGKGARFLELPVSGSVKPAQDGALILLAGGEKADIDSVKPALDAIGKLTVHTGDVGTASAAKLAINYLLALNLQGLAETVLFATANGVRAEDMLTIVNEGGMGNAITKIKSDLILKDQYPAAFALKHLTKDLRLTTEQGIDTPLAGPVYQSFKNANENGLGDEDCMAILKFLKSSATA